ncbi:MAG: 4-hydroxy-3-methylbut-2-enyl diphosphate reductase [Armatimonadetes bacterium]|jgi:4-hydroxy-3-methylbut-2-enyl diphosphate reductase|nr:4-hydroxy-3-methylbut-2-enyl diphosphate reductase [Armatimonadota bacterium]
MKVLMARQVGFCFGVKRAVNLAKQALAERDEVFILGDLIHNRAVTADLEARGLRKIDHFEGLHGGTVMVRAHGLPEARIAEARAAGLEVVDATCPIVRQAQEAARTLEERGCQVVVVGDADHPEIKGILGHLQGTQPHLVVDSVEDVREAHRQRKFRQRLGVVFQTTHAPESCQAVVAELMLIAREVQVINTICRPVRNRQLDAVRVATEADVVLVVGSFKSANSIELCHLLRKYNPNTLQIENADQLDLSRFTGSEVVGIASGLSTPDAMVEAVRDRLLAAFPAAPEEPPVPPQE